MGKPITNANLRDQRAPWWGCNAGRAIGQEVMPEADREAMWQAIQHMRRVIAAFDASIGAPKRHPACLRLLAPTDAMEADSSSPPLDTRTERERAVSAESALMKLEGWLGYADKAGASEAKRVVWDDQMVIDLPGLLIALRCVADGLKGKRLMYRGRDSTTC